MKQTIKNSSDFLFVFEAIQCNPNGDPDQENKPRMDYDTNTNLVTDTRIKRTIRDYLKDKGFEIFVDFVDDRKVSMANRVEEIVKKLLTHAIDTVLLSLEKEDVDLQKLFIEILDAAKIKADKEKEDFASILWKLLTTSSKDDRNALKKDKYLMVFDSRLGDIKKINRSILKHIVKDLFIDIRLFGSAFAISNFNYPFTGPVQMNWGYSLNNVYLMDSDSIVTIMSDDNSTFGKDYRLHYSLLGFNGTINANAAKTTGLTDDDVAEFRNAIWDAIPANPTRSKLNQYPKLYLEIVYNEGVSNGQFGDLRNYVKVKPVEGIEEKQVRKFSDLDIDLQALLDIINTHKGEGKKIKDVVVYTSPDLKISL